MKTGDGDERNVGNYRDRNQGQAGVRVGERRESTSLVSYPVVI